MGRPRCEPRSPAIPTSTPPAPETLMTPDAAYAELIRRTREAAVLASCGAVLGWDERTYMPRNGSAFRGDQMALLARLGHEMATAPQVGECLTAVEGSPLVADRESPEAINVREIRRA